MSIPGSASPLLLASTAAAAGGYQVSRSLRFNSADSAYLSRTPAVAGNRRTFTLSWWIKKSGLTTFQSLFNSNTSANDRTAINFDASIGAGAPGDYLTMFNVTSATTTSIFQTNALFRDASAWYHIVVAVDTTQATSTDRVKLWVNNTLQTFSTYNAPSQNADLNWNSATTHYYGVYGGSPSDTSLGFNGYLADVHFIDGQALTPSSFTEVSATTGQLIPKAYTGTFGTNGFWLKFSDNSAATAATLGKDYSPNGNNWTPNNLSVTAGAGNDSLVDTPTSYGTDTGVGGEIRGNYCTLNPLVNPGGSTLSNGNLDCVTSSANSGGRVVGTIGVSSGKWYWEVVKTGGSAGQLVGIAPASDFTLDEPGKTSNSFAYYTDGQKYNNATLSSYGSSWTTGDVIGVALDLDAGTIVFYKNNTSQGTAFSGLSGNFVAAVSDDSGPSTNFTINFGQRQWAYAAPAGFKALCDTNLGAPLVAKPNTLMDVALYTGNGSSQSITGLGFSPDLVWIKSRNATDWHLLTDTVRGTTVSLATNTTNADLNFGTQGVSAFNSDGFSVGNEAGFNRNGTTYVGWTWDAGTSTVSNTAGSITSQVRANVSAGFSVVTYTGTGANATVGHGLGVAPSMVIAKSRSFSQVWIVGHSSIGFGNYLLLNATDASAAGSNVFNSTAPTSTVFSLGTGTGGNQSAATYVAYCFAPVVGYSSMGSYVGNGTNDGPFVYTGFRPRWVLIKSTGSDDRWTIQDTSRSSYNASTDTLAPNLSSAELANAFNLDINSNGFKVRSTNSGHNTSSVTYIYYAVAENPFQYARAR